jgi:predicted regulator of Ras-like GTPase activity (Roadblock/LC7/MglB family)
MADVMPSVEPLARNGDPSRSPTRPSRARVFKEILASLSTIPGIRGGLLVTPDGLVITTDLPPRAQVEALAALGATLGRELELGAGRLGRGAFRAAFFSGESGTLYVGSSPLGFLILSGDKSSDVASVRVALSRALDRIHQ